MVVKKLIDLVHFSVTLKSPFKHKQHAVRLGSASFVISNCNKLADAGGDFKPACTRSQRLFYSDSYKQDEK